MRISTAYQFDTYSKRVRDSQERYFDTQNAVMTGKRITKLSDDPFGSATAMNLRSVQAATERYSKNLEVGKGILTYSEAALGDSHSVMTQAYQIAVSAANSSTDQSARDAMSAQVGDLQQQLLQYANAIGPSGQYIFAGQANDSKPFSVSTTAGSTSLALPSGTYLNYTGDNLDVTIESGPSEVMTVNTQGWKLFSDAYKALDQFKVDLQGGNVGSISGVDIQQIQDSMSQINTERGYVGTKLQSVATMTEHYTKRIDDLKTNVSDIEDVDLADAIQKYSLAQTAYQAALTVANQGYKLSLMDFISA